jgi:two-component system, NtrC family, nitrogen regulation response regulator GlnG
MTSEDPSTIAGAPDSVDTEAGTSKRLALRIVWHSDVRRIGDLGLYLPTEPSDVKRDSAPFDRAADIVLGRDPFMTIAPHEGGIELRPRPSRTLIDVAGSPLRAPRVFTDQELDAGVILLFGRAIVACLHRISFPVRRGPALDIVGESDAIEQVRRQILAVADLDASVLIRGETGTGKEVVASAIQKASKRASGPFVTVNMAAFPSQTAASELFGHERGAFTGAAAAHPGCFAQADGGTLFMDEIALAPTDVQNMLLRVLETGEYRPLGSTRNRRAEVRLLCATDANLEAAAAEGRFSDPLLHRISRFQIRLPPLRQRREDIAPLLLHFLRRSLSEVGENDRLSPRPLSAPAWLQAEDVARIALDDLRGNVRAIKNVASQLVISNRGQPHAVFDKDAQALLSGSLMELAQRGRGRQPKVTDEQMRQALKRHGNNFAAAAADLGINRATIYERMAKHPKGIRTASSLSDADVLGSHDRHAGDLAVMASELGVSRKGLAARVREILSRSKRRR